jgi:hypothetical protein
MANYAALKPIVDEHGKTIADHERRITQHSDVLFGMQGGPGLVQEFNSICGEVVDIKNFISELRVTNRILSYLGGATCVAVIGGIVTIVIKLLFK